MTLKELVLQFCRIKCRQGIWFYASELIRYVEDNRRRLKKKGASAESVLMRFREIRNKDCLVSYRVDERRGRYLITEIKPVQQELAI